LDAGGNPVGGLDADSFCVFQDNIQLNVFSVEQLTVIPATRRPASSLTCRAAWPGPTSRRQAAASGFVRNMDTFDRRRL